MTHDRRGVRQVKTIAGLVDGRRARTSYGALLELAMLEMEKTRLTVEVRRAERRCADIRKRLTDIDAKQHRLQQFVQKVDSEGPISAAAEPLPVYTVPTDKLKRRRLSY